MAPKTGRHYVGNFDLTNDPPKPGATPAPAPQNGPEQIVISTPKPAAAAPRTNPTHPPRRSGSSERRVAPPMELSPLPRDEVYVSPDDRLTGLQRAMLTALDEAADDIRPDLMLEVKNVVRGNLKRVAITPNGKETQIFERIGVPGY